MSYAHMKKIFKFAGVPKETQNKHLSLLKDHDSLNKESIRLSEKSYLTQREKDKLQDVDRKARRLNEQILSSFATIVSDGNKETLLFKVTPPTLEKFNSELEAYNSKAPSPLPVHFREGALKDLFDLKGKQYELTVWKGAVEYSINANAMSAYVYERAISLKKAVEATVTHYRLAFWKTVGTALLATSGFGLWFANSLANVSNVKVLSAPVSEQVTLSVSLGLAIISGVVGFFVARVFHKRKERAETVMVDVQSAEIHNLKST